METKERAKWLTVVNRKHQDRMKGSPCLFVLRCARRSPPLC